MKVYLILFTLFISINSVFSQNSILSKADLSNYCPTDKVQYRATCYAYGVVYTALSIEYNIANGITDKTTINKNSFSAGYVASYHNSTLGILKRSPYCGRYGFANISLDILKEEGTVLSSSYDCDCKNFKKMQKEIPQNTNRTKITDYSTFTVKNKFSDSALTWIKKAITDKHPVIIGLYQNSRLYSNKSIIMEDEIPDNETLLEINKTDSGTSNHVICIVGYDDNYKDNKGYFLIKNNFEKWGDGNGFAWVKYTYLIPLIQEAYYIKGLK